MGRSMQKATSKKRIDRIGHVQIYLTGHIRKLESDYRPIDTGCHTRIEIEGSTETVFRR